MSGRPGREPSWPIITRYFAQMAEDIFARTRMRERKVVRAAVLEGEESIRVLVRLGSGDEVVYSFGDGVLHQTGEAWAELPVYCEQERPPQGWSFIADLRQRDD